MTAAAEFVDVVVDVPVRSTFTYRIPEGFRGKVSVGHRIYVPFRGKARTGLAVRLRDRPDASVEESSISTILDVLDRDPILPLDLVNLIDWISRYYFSPPGEVMKLLLPRPLRVRGKRLVRSTGFGIQALRSGLLTDPLTVKTLTVLVEAARSIAYGTLRKKVRGLTLPAAAVMADQDLLTLEFQQAAAKRGRRLVRFLRKRSGPAEGTRVGAKQRVVLDLLEGRDRVARSEVRELSGASSATLSSLIKKAWVEEIVQEQFRDPFVGDLVPPRKDIVFTDEQNAAVAAICGDGKFDEFRSIVLHGITGSGKTEVYVESIASVIGVGKRALLLLPEIALTPQLVGIFRARFGDRVAVLHSALSEGERFDQWRRIRRGEVNVVIGARSAIFAPIEELGIVVVDEEHDGSFKQDSGVRYHARDLALVRGQMVKAVVVLGSATPSLESLQRTRLGKSQRVTLMTRPTGQPLPEVSIIDMRDVPRDHRGKPPLLSPRLRKELALVAEAGQQAILFLNRRGHSTIVVCQSCGTSWECPHCEVTLTYHRSLDRLRCHYCDYGHDLPDQCEGCGSPEWLLLGAGTEKITEQLELELKGLRILRLDRDTAQGGGLRDIIRSFRDGEADVLVGTQMVTKGHDFSNVTLVGVVMADLSLRIPDFRSGERTFQLLAQVAGRAGRGDVLGRVLIQTYNPDHPVIQAARKHDYGRFAEAELPARLALHYPPFGHLIALRFEGADLDAVRSIAGAYRAASQRAGAEAGIDSVKVLGPVEAPLARIKDRHRWQMLIRSPRRRDLRTFVARMLSFAGHGSPANAAVNVIVDVDPLNMM
jgi:primosomal protein N' (replication factor Y)